MGYARVMRLGGTTVCFDLTAKIVDFLQFHLRGPSLTIFFDPKFTKHVPNHHIKAILLFGDQFPLNLFNYTFF